MTTTYRTVTNLTPFADTTQALGEMVIAWANAESALMLALSHAAQIDANLTMTVYYRIPTFEARCKLIQSILADDLCPLPNTTEVSDSVKRLSKLSKARNDWIHGCYVTDGSHLAMFDYRHQVGHPSRRRIIKAHDINNHVKTVQARTGDIYNVLPKNPYFSLTQK